jgi:UDP-glucose 4-epimerase
VRRLVGDGHEVLAVVRPGSDPWRLEGLGVERLEVDLRDPVGAAEAVSTRPQWVFHLAAHGAYSWQTNATEILETTLASTVRLVDAAVGVEAFVHAGSSSEYGPKDHAPREDEPLEPTSAYGAAKAAATAYCRQVAHTRDAHVVTLRLYSAYGPYEDPRRFVPTLLVHALEGTLPPLVAPETARDFVHVDDVCDAFVAAAEQTSLPRGTVLNVGTGRQTTIAEAVAAARELFGVEVEPRWESHAARPWDTDRWVADPSLARKLLGWQAKTSFPDGLEATAAWLRESPLLERVYRRAIERGDR